MNQLSVWAVGTMLALLSAWAQADGVKVCYGYGCRHQVQVTVLAQEQARLAQYFTEATDAASERAALATAMQDLYQIAAQYAPIHQDKGGNVADGHAVGKMDCVDHSETDTAFLHYLQRQGWMRHHEVLAPAHRAPYFFDLHYASQVREVKGGGGWVIDSWFHDFGAKPEVVPLADWAKGWSPNMH